MSGVGGLLLEAWRGWPLALEVGWLPAIAAAMAGLRLRGRLEEVARAEHELRGPAGALFLAVERMRREPAARHHAEVLEVELARLRAGLTDLTTARTGRSAPPKAVRPRALGDRRTVAAPASRAVTGATHGGGEPFEVGAFTRGALACWAPALRAAGRPVRVDWRAGEVVTTVDQGRLAQALGNLVANAAEHGRGPVELRGRRIPGGVRIELRNLPGAEPARIVAERGRGLGIAARAAAAIGATLTVQRRHGLVLARLELPCGAPARHHAAGGLPGSQHAAHRVPIERPLPVPTR